MDNNTNNGELHRCSFCGRTEKQVDLLIPSPSGVCICDFCVDLCSQLVNEHLGPEADDFDGEPEKFGTLSMDTLPKPIQIKESLDEYIIGQDDAKVALSVAVYTHYKRILSKEAKGNDKTEQINLQKSTLCLSVLPVRERRI